MRRAMSGLAETLGQVPPVAAYGIVVVALLAESNLVIGVLVPTLTLMMTAGALAQTGYLSFPVLVAVAAGAVVVADLIGYRTGVFLGDRLRTNRLGRRVSAAAWDRADTVMARHGGRAVFPARFVPLLRTMVPHFAGATGVPYRRVAPYSVAAASVWAVLEAGAGYAAAHSVHRILTLGAPSVVAAALLGAGVFAVVHRARARRREQASRAARGVRPGTLSSGGPVRSRCRTPRGCCWCRSRSRGIRRWCRRPRPGCCCNSPRGRSRSTRCWSASRSRPG